MKDPQTLQEMVDQTHHLAAALRQEIAAGGDVAICNEITSNLYRRAEALTDAFDALNALYPEGAE